MVLLACQFVTLVIFLVVTLTSYHVDNRDLNLRSIIIYYILMVIINIENNVVQI